MVFEWDEKKNQINRRKHGVSFEVAVRVFLDDRRTSQHEIVELSPSTE